MVALSTIGRSGLSAAAPATPAVRKPKEPSPYDLLKLGIAEELGLGGKVRSEGWAALTAAETGRIGGLITRKLRELGLVPGPKGTLLPTDRKLQG